MKLDSESVLEHRLGSQGSRLGNDFVILDPAGHTLRGLNPTGARIWELVNGRRSVEAIAQQLAREYRTAVRQALADAIAFLEALVRRDLLQVAAPAKAMAHPGPERSGGEGTR